MFIHRHIRLILGRSSVEKHAICRFQLNWVCLYSFGNTLDIVAIHINALESKVMSQLANK